jgi:hypothetical protein
MSDDLGDSVILFHNYSILLSNVCILLLVPPFSLQGHKVLKLATPVVEGQSVAAETYKNVSAYP